MEIITIATKILDVHNVYKFEDLHEYNSLVALQNHNAMSTNDIVSFTIYSIRVTGQFKCCCVVMRIVNYISAREKTGNDKPEAEVFI
jgi:signal transduction histidine kinase